MPTRRRFLQMSAIAGLGLLPPHGWTGRPTGDAGDPYGFACDLTAFTRASAQSETVRVTPFALPFTQPERVAPDVRADGWHFELTMRRADVQVLPERDGPPTSIWGFDGRYPGPTIAVRRGVPAHVTQVNDLPAGMTVHLHGGHVAPDMDGHPNDLIAPGTAKTYHYPNQQETATLWYHDHGHHRTAETVHRGLAGVYLISDPAEPGYGLPAGDHDVVMLLQDRTFAPDGQFVYDPRGHMGFAGRTHLVNGVPHPVMAVDRTRYRLRIINGANARRYGLAFSDGRSFHQVGTDGGLLDRPVERTRVDLTPGERVELVVDLSDLSSGQVLYLVDVLDELAGRADETRIVRLEANAAAPRSTPVPDRLRPLPALAAPAVTRDVTVDLIDGVWMLDGRRYDPDRIDQYPRLGEIERWRFHNPSPLLHPMHLHLVMFQVERRDGVPATDLDRGWKDTVAVHPGETVDVLVRFDGFRGTYVYHCHNLEHEDHDMMAQLKVVDLPRYAGESRTATAATISRERFAPGLPRVYVTTAADFPDALAAGPYALNRGAPILLTGSDTLAAEVAAELRRLDPSEVVVVGGPKAVSARVLAQLRELVPATRRISGSSRHATAAALARDHRLTSAAAYVTTGRAFPDALAAASTVAAAGAALLLVEPDHVPPETAQAIRDLGITTVVIIGGTAAVSATVERQLRALVTTVARIAGRDRFETSARLVQERFPDPVEEVWVATGEAFPDALAGGPGAGGSPLLLTAAETLPEVTAAEIRRLLPQRIVIVGGPRAVSPAVESALADLLPD